LIKEFDIRTPGAATPAGSLSGGNQQKVIIARELSRPIDLLVASQPTRGLDVGSIEYIHKRILEKRSAGCAVLLVSSELDEIMELADRIAVMYRGEIIDVLRADEATKEGVGLLMAGIKPAVSPRDEAKPRGPISEETM
jgi:simple sugar transport system ATP-binding protein